MERNLVNRVRWSPLYGADLALHLSKRALESTFPLLIVLPNAHEVNRLKRELQWAAEGSKLPILVFPDWEILPYDIFSAHQSIISERILLLHQIPRLKQGIILISIPSLMHQMSPPDYIASHVFSFKEKDALSLEKFTSQLQQNGYWHVSQVMQPGEFSYRGSICDFFAIGSEKPLRIDLFDDEIDSLRFFDPETQRSLDKIEHFELLPAREFPMTSDAIKAFRSRFRESFGGDPSVCSVYQDISAGNLSSGIEYFIPLFFDAMSGFWDYLPKETEVIYPYPVEEAAQTFWREVEHRYEQRRHDRSHPILAVNRLFFRVDEVLQHLNAYSQIHINQESKQKAHVNFDSQPLPDVHLVPHAPMPFKRLEDFLSTREMRIIFCAESRGRQETLLELLSKIGIRPKVYTHYGEAIEDSARFGMTIGELDSGFYSNTPAFALITEADLYGTTVIHRRSRQKRQIDPFEGIHHLAELPVGSFVVHATHGVGRYLGLVKLPLGGVDTEYLCLAYQGEDKLYVPVSSLQLISRYSSADNAQASLSKLGSEQWEKAKRKAQEKLKDVAAELLDIYAKRKAKTKKPFMVDKNEYQRFQESFGFEETPDQQSAIDQVLADLQSPHPMDRLVCGDVGFGKTEVALRAIFVVAYQGKQVAVLVPTTLLAQQHYENFKNRLSSWPIRVAVLSRFQSKAEQKHILQQCTEGKIDVLVGTHKLIQDDLHFKDLGLLVIDEEHRFGVQQKERLNRLRANIDILTMTATPIPRTLNMAMASIRDLSVITTPPARRLPVKTFVREYDEPTIREAILRELMRGGQVYYLHNEVASIAPSAQKLSELIPEARVGVAHGQMREHELENIMNDFYHQRFNVLVCSTIIETGIDIPTANTIIIERADKLGLAQLHQLRGRVGRSHHQAYAYCLTPHPKLMTQDAKKRLDALAANEHLGAGFNIASHDLEIRGAGELLGEEQSGHIEAVGYTLYMELLARAIRSLQTGTVKADIDFTPALGAEIDCRIPALIPDDYLPDVQARLVLYKRIAGAESQAELQDLQVEMIDRFGLLPLSTKNLFSVTELKQIAIPYGIKKIELGPEGGVVEFFEKTPVDPKSIIQLIQKYPKHYQLQGGTKIRILQKTDTAEERFACIRSFLGLLF